jgi:hypothetical protein
MKTIAIDVFTGQHITRPVENPQLKYDFDFKKDGEWYYMSSSSNLTDPAWPSMKEAAKEGYRIVEAVTGNILDERNTIQR